MEKQLKSNKGITLIVLVITIIVLLVLAGVVIASLAGNKSITDRAQEAKEKTEQAAANEEIGIGEYVTGIQERLGVSGSAGGNSIGGGSGTGGGGGRTALALATAAQVAEMGEMHDGLYTIATSSDSSKIVQYSNYWYNAALVGSDGYMYLYAIDSTAAETAGSVFGISNMEAGTWYYSSMSGSANFSAYS